MCSCDACGARVGRPGFPAPAGEEQHLRETGPVAQGTCLSFQTGAPPVDTQRGGLPVGRGALGLWGLARRPGVTTSGWQATSICPSLSLKPPPQPAASDHPRSPRRGGRSPRSWLPSGLETNARIAWKIKQVCYPLKPQTTAGRGELERTGPCPPPGSRVSAGQPPSHQGLQQSPLLWAPGHDSEDRQTDSAGPCEPSAAGSGQCSGQRGGSPMYTAACGEGPLSDTLLHRVHGDVVVVAAHGQVRLREGGESRG